MFKALTTFWIVLALAANLRADDEDQGKGTKAGSRNAAAASEGSPAVRRAAREAEQAATVATKAGLAAVTPKSGTAEVVLAQKAAVAAGCAAKAAAKAAALGEESAAAKAESAARSALSYAAYALKEAGEGKGISAAAILAAKEAVEEAETSVADAAQLLQELRAKKGRSMAGVFGDKYHALAIGTAGKLRNGTFKVVQVIDATNVLGEIEIESERTVTYGISRSGPDTKVFPATVEVVWIRMPTKGMVDGHLVETNVVFKVTGTKQYDTAGGVSKTVFALKQETAPSEETTK